jgi:hypothetical protein
MLSLLGALVVLFYVRREKRPSALMLCMLLVIALIGSALLRDLRGRESRGETLGESVTKILTRPDWVLTPITEGPDSEMAVTFAAALLVIPEERAHTYGATILKDLATRPIPRALWEGKPMPPREELTRSLWPRDAAGINPEYTALLYFYWDFGLPGIGLGMLAYGALAHWFYAYFCRRRRLVAGQVVFAVGLWLVVIGVRDSPVDTLVFGIFTVLPAWAIFKVAQRLPARPEPMRSWPARAREVA